MGNEFTRVSEFLEKFHSHPKGRSLLELPPITTTKKFIINLFSRQKQLGDFVGRKKYVMKLIQIPFRDLLITGKDFCNSFFLKFSKKLFSGYIILKHVCPFEYSIFIDSPQSVGGFVSLEKL